MGSFWGVYSDTSLQAFKTFSLSKKILKKSASNKAAWRRGMKRCVQ